MRKLVLIAIVVLVAVSFAPRRARADVGIGAFVGEPTGLDVKLGLAQRSALDLLFGWYSDWPHGIDGGAYGHVTYLLTPVVADGNSVLVPLRLGIGAAVFSHGHFDNDVNVAARFPLEVGLRFRRTPLELYGEIALKLTFIDQGNNDPLLDVDGGAGIRFYF